MTDVMIFVQFSALHIHGAVHLDPSLLFQPESLREALGAFVGMESLHIAVAGMSASDESSEDMAETEAREGAGDEGATAATASAASLSTWRGNGESVGYKQDDVTRIMLLYFLQRGFRHVAEVDGGFDGLLRAYATLPQSLRDRFVGSEAEAWAAALDASQRGTSVDLPEAVKPRGSAFWSRLAASKGASGSIAWSDVAARLGVENTSLARQTEERSKPRDRLQALRRWLSPTEETSPPLPISPPPMATTSTTMTAAASTTAATTDRRKRAEWTSSAAGSKPTPLRKTDTTWYGSEMDHLDQQTDAQARLCARAAAAKARDRSATAPSSGVQTVGGQGNSQQGEGTRRRRDSSGAVARPTSLHRAWDGLAEGDRVSLTALGLRAVAAPEKDGGEKQETGEGDEEDAEEGERGQETKVSKMSSSSAALEDGAVLAGGGMAVLPVAQVAREWDLDLLGVQWIRETAAASTQAQRRGARRCILVLTSATVLLCSVSVQPRATGSTRAATGKAGKASGTRRKSGGWFGALSSLARAWKGDAQTGGTLDVERRWDLRALKKVGRFRANGSLAVLQFRSDDAGGGASKEEIKLILDDAESSIRALRERVLSLWGDAAVSRQRTSSAGT